jgi:dipeptidyl-peptidase-4
MNSRKLGARTAIAAITLIAFAVAYSGAQDRLKTMPGYDQYTKMQPLISGAVVSGALGVSWVGDGKSFTYTHDGKAYAFDVATLKATETGEAPAPAAGGRGGRGRGMPPPVAGQGQGQQTQTQIPPAARGRGGMEQEQTEMPLTPVEGCPAASAARGRQIDCLVSPDGKLKAFYRGRNLWVANFDGTGEKAVTTDGSEKNRIKNGTGSWVYGEELSQTTAIWWSPDSKKVGFYRFDESQVIDFYLQMNQTQVQDTLDVEAYPKPGAPNPIADVLVYDTSAGQVTRMDVRDGKPFTNDAIGHYVYNVRWSPDGTELLMNRTNRRQQIMEFTACNPSTGSCRVIVREEWPTGWTENRPAMQYLKDNRRFIWESERNGWRNYYLYDLSGKQLAALTNNTTFESGNIVKVDETAGVMYYMARDGDNYMKMQLHRVGLDGKGDVRLTDPKYNHSVGNCGGGGGRGGRGGAPAPLPQLPSMGGGGGGCGISQDNKFIVDVYQTHDQPASTQLLDASGKVLAPLAQADTTKFDQLGLKKVEMYTYKAADGQTTLYGTIAFPSNFDPAKKYPTLLSVYGGPAAGNNVPTENFTMPSATAEYGFLIVSLSSRAVPGMGKRILDSIYLKLGVTEMDDMAEGIKALWNRPYFDKMRVGIYGTSYGGYTAALEILRHPEVFTAASASSPPTAWYNYDSIYTERYMWIPQENKEGYEAGSAMNYAKDLRGRLLLYYGSADNNVHPNNSMQLIRALQQTGKSFELQVGPDQGHSGVNNQRMMEFFIENLITHPERLMAPDK